MVVTTNTLFTESWNQFYDLINSNVTDPTGKSKFIFTAFPDSILDDKSKYPIIVIIPIESEGSETFTLTRGTKDFRMTVTMEVYSTNAKQLDELSDSVFSTIENNELTLYNNNLDNFDVTSVTTDTVIRGKHRVHMRTVEWGFSFKKVG